MIPTDNISKAPLAFGKQAAIFDAINNNSVIINGMRKKVYRHMEKWLSPGSGILELNAGTGIDACYFAAGGHTVLATDASGAMLLEAEKKIVEKGLQENITTMQCSFTNLDRIETKPFDHIFSNFGGLNCVADMKDVTRHFPFLLKPGAYITLVMISPFCLWETLMALNGNFELAFRRFKKGGAPSKVEGISFMTHYFRPSTIQKALGGFFHLQSLEGLAVFSPPPYLEERLKNEKKILNALSRMDSLLSKWPLLRHMGDHFIITFRYLPK